MKTTVEVILKESDKQENKYPYYGESKGGYVVFFDGPNSGMCMRCGGNVEVGAYSKRWIEEAFIPIIGTITIMQE